MPRVADMRPGDYFGALFLVIVFAVVIGVLSSVALIAWFMAQSASHLTLTFPTP